MSLVRIPADAERIIDPPGHPLEERYALQGHIPLDRELACIEQVDERYRFGDRSDGWVGRQSCVLTSQLNALILPNIISQEEALHVQHAASTQPKYDRFWLANPTHLGWAHDARNTRKLIQVELGVFVRIIETHDPRRVETALLSGCTVALSGLRHNVTALQSHELRGTTECVVINPQGCQTEPANATNLAPYLDPSKPSYIVP